MTWLSAPELAGLPGLPGTPRGALKYAQAECLTSRPRSGVGRTGFEYLSTDLPLEAQQALAAQAAGAIKPYVDAIEAGKFAKQVAQTQACATSMAKYGIVMESKGGFDPTRNPKLDLFQRFEKYHAQRGTAVWPAVLEFVQIWGAGHIEAHPSTRQAYPTIPAKTLDKWYRAWRTQGVEALLERKPRKDKGENALNQDEQLYDAFIAALAEMHDPTARQVQRVIKNHLGESRTPPISTLRRWLQDFKASNAPSLLMFKNPDGYKNKYRPAFGSQSEGITRSNQQWQQDSTIGDAQQRADLTFNITDANTGEIRRHAIIASIDVFTRRAKVVVSNTSNSNAVKAVTRQCIQAWGKPEQIKTDNGKDYTADDFNFALDSLGIEHLLCTPFSPEQKPYVERFIGTLMHDLFPMLEGFVGKSVAERKAIESAKSFAQRFGLEGIDLRMGARQLQDVINGWLAEVAAFVSISLEQYGVKTGGDKGNVTLVSYDGRYKLVRQMQDKITFGEQLMAAKSLIDECVHEWAVNANDNIKALVNHAFQTDKEGKINTGRVLSLRRLDIKDEKWQAAMQAIADSMQTASTKPYVRFYKRNETTQEYVAINLDVAAV